MCSGGRCVLRQQDRVCLENLHGCGVADQRRPAAHGAGDDIVCVRIFPGEKLRIGFCQQQRGVHAAGQRAATQSVGEGERISQYGGGWCIKEFLSDKNGGLIAVGAADSLHIAVGAQRCFQRFADGKCTADDIVLGCIDAGEKGFLRFGQRAGVIVDQQDGPACGRGG